MYYSHPFFYLKNLQGKNLVLVCNEIKGICSLHNMEVGLDIPMQSIPITTNVCEFDSSLWLCVFDI